MQHITIRLTDSTLAKVEDYREKLEKSAGIPVKRADALRAVIDAGVDAKLKELGKKA